MNAPAEHDVVPRLDFAGIVATLGPGARRHVVEAARAIEQDPTRFEAMIAADEQRARDEIDAQRRAARYAAYVATRQPDSADASLAGLHPHQDPDRRVSGWWASGRKSLLIAGLPGRGKTQAAHAIANAVAADDRDGRTSTPVLVQAWRVVDLKELHQPPSLHEARDEVASARRARQLEVLTTCELLILDDLTAARITDSFREFMHKVIDARTSNPRCRTIFTANADDQRALGPLLQETVGAPIVSRMRQDAVPVWLDGPDLRTFATWDPFA